MGIRSMVDTFTEVIAAGEKPLFILISLKGSARFSTLLSLSPAALCRRHRAGSRESVYGTCSDGGSILQRNPIDNACPWPKDPYCGQRRRDHGSEDCLTKHLQAAAGRTSSTLLPSQRR
jgi:hypothetical protein